MIYSLVLERLSIQAASQTVNLVVGTYFYITADKDKCNTLAPLTS